MLGTHEKIVLQFSGGKDALACLYLMRPHWDRIIVAWVNTGDAFPETIEQMAAIKSLVPNFVEVKSDQPGQTAENGLPVDLVPVWHTPIGRRCRTGSSERAQSPFDCCYANIWKPLDEFVRAVGATLVIRGQRAEERVKAPIRSGHIEDGIEYLFPIEDWTQADVLAYLVANDVVLPRYYTYVNSSLDCQHCTAYLFENRGKFDFIEQYHPALHDELQRTLRGMRKVAHSELQHLTDVIRVE